MISPRTFWRSLALVISAILSCCITVFACCSIEEAEFTNTVGWVSEIERDGKRIHLLGYANTARNLNSAGGNAMFLPIPAVKGTMSETNIIDTTGSADLLDAMQRTASQPFIHPVVATVAGGTIALCILAAIFRTAARKLIKAIFERGWLFVVLPWMLYSASAVIAFCLLCNRTLLAPTEALIDTLANGGEILGIVFGAVLLASVFHKSQYLSIGGHRLELTTWQRFWAGLFYVLLGLALPGTVNYITSCSRDANLFDEPGEPIVFNSGIYTVVLADDPNKIPSVLHKVPRNKRPEINREIFDAYAKWYEGWTFALCCFDNRDASKSTPMVWWYEPNYPNLMFFPALDAHDGKPPILNTNVEVDHFLVLASDRAVRDQGLRDLFLNPWQDFKYTGSAAIASYLPRKVMGRLYHESMRQGDFVFKIQDVRQGSCQPQRVLPPGVEPSKIWSTAI